MGKYAKFNRDEVIEKATNLYWQKGFHATSMRNLQDVIDMRPGSIYATFGSKENLFRESIHHYAQNGRELLQNCIDNAPTPLTGLKQFIKTVIIERKAASPSGMCMIVKTVAELTEQDNPELLSEAKRALNDIEVAFTNTIEQAMAIGEIDSSKNAALLAQYVQIQLIGLRTYARATDDCQSISQFIDNIFEASPFH